MMEKFKKNAIRGIKWATLSQVIGNILSILTTTILARILDPSDFGLMGMALTITGFVEVFKDLGTSAALIQRKDTTNEFYSSVFWINVFFGIFLSLLLFLVSPIAGIFYNDVKIEFITKILSINFLITGIGVTHKAILEKELRFNRLAMAELLSMVLGSIVGIVCALKGFGVYSLVVLSLTKETIFTIIVLIATPYMPKLYVSISEVKSIFKFSYFLIFHQIQNYFSRNIDYLLIGKFLGPQALGYYTLAYKLMLIPIRSICNAVSRVTFPVFSLHQDENEKIRQIVKSTTEFISFITIPMMFGIFFVTDPLLIALLGTKWIPSIKIIMILSVSGLIQSISIPLNSIFIAKGKADLLFYYGVISTIAITIGISIGLSWDIVGVSIGYVVSGICIAIPAFYYRLRLIDMTIYKFATATARNLLSGIIMIALLFLAKFFVAGNFDIASRSIIFVSVGILIYSVSSFVINKNYLVKLLKGTFNKF